MSAADNKVLLFVKKNPLGVSCGVITVALAVFAFLRFDTVSEAEDIQAQRAAQADRLAQNIINSAQLKEQHAELLAAMDKINVRLINENTLASNLQYFYRLEAEQGVKVVELTQSKDVKPVKAKPSSYFSIPFALSIEGEYPKVISYLRALESGHRYCRINSVIISPSSLDPSLVTMSFRLEILGQL